MRQIHVNGKRRAILSGQVTPFDHLQGYLIKWAPRIVIAAWGKPCMASQRGQHRAETIKRNILGMKCWGKNSDGSPRHPLMLPYSTQLEVFN